VWDSDPNGGLLCVDGRFAPLYDTRKRLTKPLVRKDGKLVEASWDEALNVAADKLKAGNAEGLALGATTNEALAAFATLFEKVGGQAGALEPVAPVLGYGQEAAISDILDADFIVVAGADPLEYQRVIGYFVHRAADKGATVAVITEGGNELSKRAAMTVSYADAAQVAEAAAGANKIVLIYSVGIKPKAIMALKPLADKLHYLALSPARNLGGAKAAGLAPVSPNGAATQFVLLGEQSEAEGLAAQLKAGFTIVQASYQSPLVEQADVVLPSPIWCEQTGHVTNLEGKVLPLNPSMAKPGLVRDEAEVLTTLAGMV
jgi:predicted molibdopterin-dependent oxidoreductase YjgC